MTFPFTITINDEQEFNRLLDAIGKPIARMAAKETALLFGKSKPTMSTADCYRESGSRTAVDQDTKNGKLKYTLKNGKRLYKREDFNKWNSKNSF